MKKHAITMLLVISLTSVCFKLHAQSGPTVAITSPDPTAATTVVNESQQSSGVSLVAQATPANGADGACVTFDWTDQYGGDWGPGTLSSDGLTSTLTYYPPGGAYGNQVTMSVTVQDNVNPASSPATVNLIVPLISSAVSGGPHSTYKLSYYGGADYEDTDSGNGETYLQFTITPTPSATNTIYTWTMPALLIEADGGANQDTVLVNSAGYSAEPGDQDVQLNGPDGSEAADQALTVVMPNSSAIDTHIGSDGGGGYNDSSHTGYGIFGGVYKGYNTGSFTQVSDQFTFPSPVNTQVVESFGSKTSTVTNTWFSLGAYTFSTDNTGVFEDDYDRPWSYIAVPQPLWPTDSGAGANVWNEPQTYSGGASATDVPAGCFINTHTLNMNYGNGRQSP